MRFSSLAVSSARQAAALPAAPADAASHYAFLALDQGRPVRYDPCQPIHYTVNVAQAPASALTDLQEAVHRVSAATGLARNSEIAFSFPSPSGRGLGEGVPGC